MAFIIGGHRELLRQAGLLAAIEAVAPGEDVPCQQCGIPTMVMTESAQYALRTGAAVLCIWCGFAGDPTLAAKLPRKPVT
jgi:hypothetical protein